MTMKTTALLKMAAILAFVQFCAHTAMFVTYVPRHGPDEVSVIDAMRSHHFLFSGALRSYWDFYFGYGLLAAFTCLLESVLFWQLGSLARTNAALTRPMVGLFLLANLVYAIWVRLYFFPLPAYFDVAIAIVLGSALFTAARGVDGRVGAAA
jgi:hypothetical protein